MNRKPKPIQSGDEPLMDAQYINLQWGKTWPKVIARAWYIDEQKKKGQASQKDVDWLSNLLSGKKESVRKALEEEGFAPTFIQHKGNNEKNAPYHFEWFWNFTNILVKRAEDGADILKRDIQKDEVTAEKRTVNGKDEYFIREQEIDNAESTEYELYGWGTGDETRINGWVDDTRLAHTLILTLPPKPQKAEIFALAITDYEAKGLVYPFSICCC